MEKKYLEFNFASFKETLDTAYNEWWDYSEKDASNHAAECAYEDLEVDVDKLEFCNTLRSIAHDILNGSNMTDVRINADDLSDYDIIYSKKFFRALETRSTEDETLYIFDTAQYSEDVEVLQTYIDENKPSIGYYWCIEELIAEKFDPDLEYCEQDVNFGEYRLDGDMNEGPSIKGCLLLKWSYEKYVGYARRFHELEVIVDDLHEADIMTDNEDSTMRVNCSILLNAEEMNEPDDRKLIMITNRLADNWKWVRKPTEEYIIETLDLEF